MTSSAREPRPTGRPRKDTFRIPGEKPCTHCGVSQALEEFPKNKNTSDGLASWCYSCHREYGRTYKKKQPSGDEMMQAINREPRSDLEMKRRNDLFYKTRQASLEKPTCAYPGCITKINYIQGRLCMMHEQEMIEEKVARKLAKG